MKENKTKNEVMNTANETKQLSNNEKLNEYINLHNQIVTYGKISCENLLYMAKCLKKMNDEKLYLEGGYQCFEDYSEKELGLKKSQAYKYIQVIENCGEDIFHSNGKLGITKLSLLSSISEEDRKEVIENNKVEEISVDELKKLIEEQKKKIQQLELNINTVKEEEKNAKNIEFEKIVKELDISKSDLDKAKKDAENIKKKLEQLEIEKKNQETKITMLEATPKEKEIQIVKDENDKKTIQELSEKLKNKEAEIEKLNNKIKIGTNPALNEFKIKFKDWQIMNKDLMSIIEKLDIETKTKCKSAIKQIFNQMEI